MKRNVEFFKNLWVRENHFHEGAIVISVTASDDPARIAKRTFDYIKDVTKLPRAS